MPHTQNVAVYQVAANVYEVVFQGVYRADKTIAVAVATSSLLRADGSAGSVTVSSRVHDNGPIGGLAFGINYYNVDQLNLRLGSGDVHLNVQSTAAGTTTTIKGNGGNNTFNVSSDATSIGGVLTNSGNLLGIVGPLLIDAGAGAASRLIVSNLAGPTNPYVIQGPATVGGTAYQQVTGFAPAALSYTATGGKFTDGATNDGVLFRLANTGDNTINLRSTLGGGNTTFVQGNGNNDTFNVSSDADSSRGGSTNNGDLLGVAGTLTVVGGPGPNNRIVVSNFGGAATPNVEKNTATVAGQAYQLITGFAPASVYYAAVGRFFDDATTNGVVLRGSNHGGDTFLVHRVPPAWRRMTRHFIAAPLKWCRVRLCRWMLIDVSHANHIWRGCPPPSR